ncbi:helix-turn-helix domain-containing protein [Paracidovorax cattleyae]|uniref:Helix-turn-helix domain-containing protein n=1 Tax=Paracidovorax cattleyae TaxID=80868 RepID=A0A1H0RI27_9BURK|nr:helix-turn-helix domain-containing protein [Paracidovorax cattleyae]SDP28558.1 Helix-turn-helix domain-containing protein [Paracidovorax cattleyae]
MSVKVMTAVFERYPSGGGEMLLALALADHASDDGTKVFPSVETLADKTRQSVRSVQYQLRRMEEAGWLILVSAGNGGRSMTREYRISIDWIKGAEIAPIQKGAIRDEKGATDDTKGCNPEQETVQPVAPANNRHRTISEPSLNRSAAAAPAKPSRGSTLPTGFEPDQTAADMAARSGIDLQAELANFLDHHTARGTIFKDWQAAFRTWLRNAVRFGQRGAGGGARRGPPEMRYAAAAATIYEGVDL